MKNALILIFLCLFSSASFAQSNLRYTYYLDGNLAPVEAPSAVFIGRGLQQGNGVKMNLYKIASGQLCMSASFTDSTLNIMHGLFTSFFDNGTIENEGAYDYGYENGGYRRAHV